MEQGNMRYVSLINLKVKNTFFLCIFLFFFFGVFCAFMLMKGNQQMSFTFKHVFNNECIVFTHELHVMIRGTEHLLNSKYFGRFEIKC